jgi:glyoxylase-like metal-dependent hydrolase (beta-lactamase superfamily II)
MKQVLRRVLATGAVLFGLAVPAWAEIPAAGTQVPGFYRLRLGEFEVTALFDGATRIDTKLLHHTSGDELQRLLGRMFVDNPTMQTSVNAYLVNTGDHLALIDTGGGALYGPVLGRIADNLRAAGYAPEQVDTVLLTHIHGDHDGGLIDAAGRAAFPNARVFAPQEDADYWLSPEAEAAAPKDRQRSFQTARATTAPYREAGRWSTFAPGDSPVPGIRAVAAHGHTPGHTAFAVESEGQTLLVWGDIVHAHAVQFHRPGVSIDFDVSQKQAIAARRDIMKRAAEGRVLVAGMHLPFPGIGHVRAEGNGRYAWVPVEFSPLPPRPTP